MNDTKKENFIRKAITEINTINKETDDIKKIAEGRIAERSKNVIEQINIDMQSKMIDNEKQHKEQMKLLQEIENNIQNGSIDSASELLKQL